MLLLLLGILVGIVEVELRGVFSNRTLVVTEILLLILIKLLCWLVRTAVLPAIKCELRLVYGLLGLRNGGHIDRFEHVTVLDPILMHHVALLFHVVRVDARVKHEGRIVGLFLRGLIAGHGH